MSWIFQQCLFQLLQKTVCHQDSMKIHLLRSRNAFLLLVCRCSYRWLWRHLLCCLLRCICHRDWRRYWCFHQVWELIWCIFRLIWWFNELDKWFLLLTSQTRTVLSMDAETSLSGSFGSHVTRSTLSVWPFSSKLSFPFCKVRYYRRMMYVQRCKYRDSKFELFDLHFLKRVFFQMDATLENEPWKSSKY